MAKLFKSEITMIFTISLIGAILGYVVFEASNRLPYIQWEVRNTYIVSGALLSLIIYLLIKQYTKFVKKFYVEEITLSIPEFSEMKIKVNREYRKIAWKLFVESITRITTQPLQPETGHLREALESLYSLFSTTRDLLKEMGPTPVAEGTTVELFAIRMLNREIRPFLSKWHRLLTEFEKNHPELQESDWELNQKFREELEELRKTLLQYTRGFGEIAGVQQLSKYV
ncbi:MAG: hypothetical protein M1347_00755 [Chloroflexi bacterium]|nr:hypothetical protein [Chloroflexota bacterium]